MYTTVILAQPRGPRLRADAVYVDRSGVSRACFGRAGSLSVGATVGTFDPPEPGPFILEFGANKIVILW